MSTLDYGILEKMNLTDKERKFIETSGTTSSANAINQSRIISEFYASKTLHSSFADI